MTNTAAYTILSASLMFSSGFLMAKGMEPEPMSARDHAVQTCEWTQDYNSDSGAMLESAGWFGHPADGMEMLYSPACSVTINDEKNLVEVSDNTYTVIRTFTAP